MRVAGGGCACGEVRYALTAPPLFIHACHCRWCQRESGAAFALNAMVLGREVVLTHSDVVPVRVPVDGTGDHWIARCAACQIALWSCYGARDTTVRYLKVGTLDDPDAYPPQAHIFVSQKQPWVVLPEGARTFRRHYDAAKIWPAESVARRAAART